MASINISEADFEAVAGAAWAARESGDGKAAAALDKIARKINASLSKLPYDPLIGPAGKSLTWKDVPSVFDV